MPRYRPDFFETGVYHIYNRGVAKLPIFLADDDYHDFQDILHYYLTGFHNNVRYGTFHKIPEIEIKEVTSRTADPQGNGLFRSLIDVVAYCLMPNHFHLLVQLKKDTGQVKIDNVRYRTFQIIPELMKRVCVTYCNKFNNRHQREGVLLQGEYKIKAVPTDSYVIQVSRYMHQNPVTAGLVKNPEDWLWSDYFTYLHPEALSQFKFVNHNLILSYFENSRSEYVNFIQESQLEENQELAKLTIDQDEDM